MPIYLGGINGPLLFSSLLMQSWYLLWTLGSLLSLECMWQSFHSVYFKYLLLRAQFLGLMACPTPSCTLMQKLTMETIDYLHRASFTQTELGGGVWGEDTSLGCSVKALDTGGLKNQEELRFLWFYSVSFLRFPVCKREKMFLWVPFISQRVNTRERLKGWRKKILNSRTVSVLEQLLTLCKPQFSHLFSWNLHSI